MPPEKTANIPHEIEEVSTKPATPAISHRPFALAMLIFTAAWLSGEREPGGDSTTGKSRRSARRLSQRRRISVMAKRSRKHRAQAATASAVSSPPRAFRTSQVSDRCICTANCVVYQAGGRGNTPMNNVVKFLSDDALIKVAAYYASLDPAPPAPAPKSKAGAERAQSRSTPAKRQRPAAAAVTAKPASARRPACRALPGSIRNTSSLR